MEKFQIKINDLVSLNLYTDSDIVKQQFLHKQNKITKTIPGTIICLGNVDKITDETNYILYLKGNREEVHINKEKNTAFLSLAEDKLFFPDLVYLAIGMLANALQHHDLYFMQSSVVKYNDNDAIMILGNPNAGKTTIAYKLTTNYGWSLVSNDNVLVGIENNKLKTYCGTKDVQMRLGSINLYCPELKDKINGVKNKNPDMSEWDIKVFVDDILKEYGVLYADESNVSDIYLVETFLSDNLFVREREGIDKVLLLYEHLTKQIRNNRYALVSFDYPLPSFEDDVCAKKRYDMSKIIADSTSLYEAKGDIRQLVKKMKR